MAEIHSTAPSVDEKRDESHKPSVAGSDESPSRLEIGRSETALILNEDEVFARARANPKSAMPIRLTFAHDDPDNPRNWPKWKKWYITCFASFLNVMTCFAAGGYSSGQEEIVSLFGVSGEVGVLGLSLYILGFALGPMLLAPLSEYYGRTPVYIGSWFILAIFQIPIALADNMATVLVCRLITGLGGSAPLTNTGGSISDVWERNESGNAMTIYGVSSTMGPPFALVLSGYIVLNEGWRDLFWVYLAVFGGILVIMCLTLPETRHSIILERKASRVRKTLITENLLAPEDAANISDIHSQGHKRSMHSLFATNLTRPFRFLFTEPITLFGALYNGLIYGIVFLFNEAFPLVFADGHGFNTGQTGLTFLGLSLGTVVAAFAHPFQERYYLRRVAANDGKCVPEARMYQACFGAFLLPISLFWFAWTSYPTVHWIVPIIASGFFGAGIYIVILGVLNYIVDSYQTYSASSLAGVILVRNLVGAGFPLFAKQMYERLGLEWASSLLAFVGILFVPIPIWWFMRGEQLRMKSKWAREHFGQDEDAPH